MEDGGEVNKEQLMRRRESASTRRKEREVGTTSGDSFRSLAYPGSAPAVELAAYMSMSDSSTAIKIIKELKGCKSAAKMSTDLNAVSMMSSMTALVHGATLSAHPGRSV